MSGFFRLLDTSRIVNPAGFTNGENGRIAMHKISPKSIRVLPVKGQNHSCVPFGNGYLFASRPKWEPANVYRFWLTDSHFNEIWVQDANAFSPHGKVYDPRLFIDKQGIFIIAPSLYQINESDQGNLMIKNRVEVIGDCIKVSQPETLPQFGVHEKNWIPYRDWVFYDFDRHVLLDKDYNKVYESEPLGNHYRGGSNVVEYKHRLVTFLHSRTEVGSVEHWRRGTWKAHLLVMKKTFPFQKINLVEVEDSEIVDQIKVTNTTHWAQRGIKTVVFPMSLLTQKNGFGLIAGVNDSASVLMEFGYDQIDKYLDW